MVLSPTHRARSPYLFHFDGQTVALGESEFLVSINERLVEQGYITRPTFWDQAYTADVSVGDVLGAADGAGPLGGSLDDGALNSVGVACGREEFWGAMYARAFEKADWSEGGDTLYMPQLPLWLERTRSWVFDPLAPADGPGLGGGWVRVRETPGGGQPVGLFQLTSPDSFWVFGSAVDVAQVRDLCRDLAQIRTGFGEMTVYLGYDLAPSSLCLPVECKLALQEELFLAGVDVETLFWDGD